MKKINIAIDGPSAAGKSSVAERLADSLSYVHLDTGSMYRAIAYYVDYKGFSLNDEEAILALLNETEMTVLNDGTIKVNDLLLKKELYGDKISLMASDVSKLLGVRKAMVALQQKIAANKGYIVDGRDICEVVLPDAEVKIYLTASAEARAMRRYKQNQEKGIESNYEDILKDIEKRDYQDMHRENSPLRQANDATLVDSSNMSLDETVDTILNLVKEKMKND